MLLLLVISVKVIDVRVYIPCSKFPFFRRWFIFLSHLSLGAKFSLNILDIDLVCNIFYHKWLISVLPRLQLRTVLFYYQGLARKNLKDKLNFRVLRVNPNFLFQ